MGLDTIRSTDHDWGPRVMIFLDQKDYDQKAEIDLCLKESLPSQFLGFSTSFRIVNDDGIRVMAQLEKEESVNHGISILTKEAFFEEYLGVNLDQSIKPIDWLLFSEHKLRTIKDGIFFKDDLNIEASRKILNYYPEDIWLYLLASEWKKIAQEEHIMARCGEAGDELGSKIIASRLVQSIMNLIFLMEKEYVPYSKWLGIAFSDLDKSKTIKPHLGIILQASTWKEREFHLSEVYQILGVFHNDLEITKELDSNVRQFHDRPFQVIDADRYANAIRAEIKNTAISNIMSSIGSVNQITNTVDLLENNNLLKRMKILFE